MLVTIEAILGFIAGHWDLIELAYDAIENKGLSKDQTKQAIQQALVAAADAQMKIELGK